MAMIRRIYRIVFIFFWFFIIWILLIFARINSYWKAQRMLGKISILWGRVLTWILGIKIDVKGDLSSFKGGLVVSNHTGYVDILVQAAVLPIRFAPKSSIRHWPFIGWFIATGRPIWIDRSSRHKSKEVAKQFKDSMDNGVPILVYPEGTSTSGEKGILKFKSTPFEAAVHGDNWLLPTIIRYKETPDKKPIAWYDDMTLLPHLWRILGYRNIFAELHVMKPFKPEGRSRKELAQYTYEKMIKEYNKIFERTDD
jgi:1-acyl-sn-glycerol-3-phosphate acyltransferase